MHASKNLDQAQGASTNPSVSAVNLPFTVSIVRTEEHLTKAVEIRARSYGRHHPEVAAQLQEPEGADRSPVSLVLLAESKSTNEPLGTLRIETNLQERLPVESLLPAESPYSDKSIAFVTRLAVGGQPDASLVKLTLFKALHRYCLACQIDWIIVTAKPPMDRQYSRLGFSDVYEHDNLLPISWSGNIPMRIMALQTISCERIWRKINHPLYKFMFVDYCPDIKIFESVSGIWSRPRLRDLPTPAMADLDSILGPI